MTTDIVRALVTSEIVRLNVRDAEQETHIRSLFEANTLARIRFHQFPTNDAWCRDYGAIFLVNDDDPERPSLIATDWRYHARSGAPDSHEEAMPRRMAETLAVPCFPNDLALWGGAIDTNGAGTLLAARQAVLGPNRNPGTSQEAAETQLRRMLGGEQVLWLDGSLAGDPACGFLDNVVRFVAEDTVLLADAPHQDENHAPLQACAEVLKRAQLSDGRPLQVRRLPLPAPRYHEGQRLPASYTTFYIANRIVLLPAYGDPNDAAAQDILAACFPERRIVPIACAQLTQGLRILHGFTQQVPV